MTKKVVEPVPAATVVLIRDNEIKNDIDVFLIERNIKADFASGALVFPGGKIDDNDGVAGLRERTFGAEKISDTDLPFYCGAVRETFEESGFLFTREKGSSDLISPERKTSLEHYRDLLNSGEITFLDFLEKEDLVLALDQFTLFARWITPALVSRRFDTFFFVAIAPLNQNGLHDGSESVDSLWITPEDALNECGKGKYDMMFPTRMNVKKLSENKSVEEVIESSLNRNIITVLPEIKDINGKLKLTIPKEADYGITEEFLDNVLEAKLR